MITFIRAYFTTGYWTHTFRWRKAASDALAAVGALWLITSVLSFLSFDKPTDWLKSNWWIYLILGIAWAAWESRPKLSFSCNLKNRDVTISIRIGDIFSGSDDLIIGCNTTFDTELHSNLISKSSLQGKFTSQYYNEPSHLDADISRALEGVPSSGTTITKPGKSALYPIGTTVTVRPRGRTSYLCAFATINEKGNASATLDELKQALPALWEHIANAGDLGSISIPILGSSFGRVDANRELLIHEILRSFIAACSTHRPCSAITVVIYHDDYYKYKLDIDELGQFVSHLCKYTEFASRGRTGQGLPLHTPERPDGSHA